MSAKTSYIEEMCRELEERRNYLSGQAIRTIYFGGGTPTQLLPTDLESLFKKMEALFDLSHLEEVTLEANPDDITSEYLHTIRHLPFNRISLGVQSFKDEELRFLNRRHNAHSAQEAVRRCQEAGFENISIDLMYGLPGQTIESWQETIRQALDLNIQHISAYHLIYEEGTRLEKLLTEKQITPIDEELSLLFFEQLIDRLAEGGFKQYEISNFSRPGRESKHNSSYWNGSHYLGIGAAAHSYNGESRQWNATDILAYRKQSPEVEQLSETDRFNDFILTRLRTMQGISLDELSRLFGKTQEQQTLSAADRYRQDGSLCIEESHLRLTRRGIFISDSIMSSLMI